ncbi:hypothetical protein Tco_1220408 [Tanacetum coccineum]
MTTNVVDREVYVHGIHDGLKEGTVVQAPVTSGDVSSSSNSTVSRTEGTTTVINVTSDDVSNVSAKSSGSSNVQTGIPTVNTGSVPFINVINPDSTSPNKNGGVQVGHEPIMNKFSSSYATKLSPTSLTKANLRKLEVNVPNDVDYDVWLLLVLVHEVNDRMKKSLYDYSIGKRLAFPL